MKFTIIAATTVGFLLTPERNSDATWVQRVGSSCVSMDGVTATSSGNLENTSTSLPLRLICPIEDDSVFQKSQFTSLTVHGGDDNGTNVGWDDRYWATAQTCITYYSTTGGACDGLVYTSAGFTGDFNISPPRSYWTSTYVYDYGYLSINLPANQYAASFVSGYVVQN
jgi:hypothetical protein